MKLIRLRKEKDVITTGKFELLLRKDRKIFAYKRIGEKETLIVLCNFSNEHVKIEDLDLVTKIENANVIISNDKQNNNRKVLTPYEAVVYSLLA